LGLLEAFGHIIGSDSSACPEMIGQRGCLEDFLMAFFAGVWADIPRVFGKYRGGIRSEKRERRFSRKRSWFVLGDVLCVW
jgi:hypothetical protein